MAEGGKLWGKGTTWSDAELQVIRDNPDMTAEELTALLPGRTLQSIGNKRWTNRNIEVPPVKEPGNYIESVSALIADDFELMGIWCKWNGYAAWRELSRDMTVGAFGIVTAVCAAK